MAEDEIVEYKRQGPVNKAFGVILFGIIAIAALLRILYPGDLELGFWLFTIIPVGVLLLSTVFGILSKRAIDYVPGEWQETKKWMSFTDYEKTVEDYEDAYGHLYGNTGGIFGFFILLPITVALGSLSAYFLNLSIPLFDPLIDSLLLLVILYAIVGVAGFVNGFRIPSIDAEEFFKAPIKGDVYDFARELQGVKGYRAGLNVKFGVRSGVQTILEAEIKTYLEGLPDTVSVGVQVSHSGFAYPYLVGTVYKGSPVSKGKERYNIRTKYPAMVETSMDGEVSVFVTRFDIPQRTSGVPSISNRDFRRLALLLADKLNENYNAT
ncbi:MAG: hypothetical protein ACXADC_11690 [Candidatus Thorarchaeota archaeon]|jgi:hypothetical protein